MGSKTDAEVELSRQSARSLKRVRDDLAHQLKVFFEELEQLTKLPLEARSEKLNRLLAQQALEEQLAAILEKKIEVIQRTYAASLENLIIDRVRELFQLQSHSQPQPQPHSQPQPQPYSQPQSQPRDSDSSSSWVPEAGDVGREVLRLKTLAGLLRERLSLEQLSKTQMDFLLRLFPEAQAKRIALDEWDISDTIVPITDTDVDTEASASVEAGTGTGAEAETEGGAEAKCE